MRRRTELVFWVVFAAIVIFAYSERYVIGQYLCRNFKDTWLEKSGFSVCYRAP